MKKIIIILICLQLHFVSFAQIFNNFNEVTPYEGEIAAVKKGDQWGFIDKEGNLIIAFRDNFVLTKNINNSGDISLYPVFRNERCLIKKLVDNSYFFGYIDKTGNEVISPKYLNASNFKNGYAIIVKNSEDVIGYNKVLKKDIISTKIEEFIINPSGEIVKYLENPRNNDVPQTSPKTPPSLYSKFIAPNIIAVKKKDQKWDIYKF